jgi:hypothetical protein
MKVRFTNPQEIRMGSPYHVADLILDGPWKPDLPDEEWQDLTAQSADGRYVGLVAWDIRNNTPGFKVYTIDTLSKTVAQTDRIAGCCQQLEWKPGIVNFVWMIN